MITAPGGKIRVIEGDDLRLSCKTTKDWHSCTWRKASIEESCRFVYKKLRDTYDEWKPVRLDCVSAYRDPEINVKNDKIWYDQCGENNRECTITISDAKLSDAGEWYCKVEPCETIKGIGCTEKGAGKPNETKVFVEVRCINMKYSVAIYYGTIHLDMF